MLVLGSGRQILVHLWVSIGAWSYPGKAISDFSTSVTLSTYLTMFAMSSSPAIHKTDFLTEPRHNLLCVLFSLWGLLWKHPFSFQIPNLWIANVSRQDHPNQELLSYTKSAYVLLIISTLPDPHSEILEAYLHLNRQIISLLLEVPTIISLKHLCVWFNTPVFCPHPPPGGACHFHHCFGVQGVFCIPVPSLNRVSKQNKITFYEMWINKFSPLGRLFNEMGGK